MSYSPYNAPRLQEFLDATHGWTQRDFCAFMLYSWAMKYSPHPRNIRRFKDRNFDKHDGDRHDLR